MSSTNLVKILLFILIAFALVEIIFAIQRYGLPHFSLTSKPSQGSCKILEEKYCTSGKIIKFNNITYIGINLPPGKSVSVFAPADGQISFGKEGGNPFNGTLSTIKAKDGDTYIIRGNLDASELEKQFDKNVKTGGLIGYAQSTNLKSLGYDIVIAVRKTTPGGVIDDEDTLRKLFRQ